MVTLGYYEISIGTGRSGCVCISDSAILEHRPGHSVILPAKPSVVLGPSALPKLHSVYMVQGPFPADRFNGSILQSKVLEFQLYFLGLFGLWIRELCQTHLMYQYCSPPVKVCRKGLGNIVMPYLAIYACSPVLCLLMTFAGICRKLWATVQSKLNPFSRILIKRQ